ARGRAPPAGWRRGRSHTTSRKAACPFAIAPRTTRRRRLPAGWGSGRRPVRRLPPEPTPAAVRPTTGGAGGGAPGHSAIGSTPVSSTEHSCSHACWSTDEIDRGEQCDPDDVDEVPVVGDNDRRGRLRRGELAHRGASQQEDEGDQPADDVQPVETGGQVEDAAVSAAGDGGPVAHQVVVLIGLTEDEEQS